MPTPAIAVRLTSVNVGMLETLGHRTTQRTGIRKHPIGGSVLCDTQGLLGDAIGNRKHHGGPDQAVYLYSAADYAWWADTLGRACEPGLFGENLTIDAWWDTPRVGDRVQFGDVLLELTAPRIPCATLAARMGDPHFVQRFAQANRGGAYARVLQSGALHADMPGHVVRGDDTWAPVHALFSLWYRTPRSPAVLLDALRAPVSERLRVRFLEWAATG